MMTKWMGMLLGVLFLFSCGEIPEMKPEDWTKRQDFSDKKCSGAASWWEDPLSDKTLVDTESSVQNLDKSQRWKGSGKFSSDGPVYYVFKANRDIKAVIDWRYRKDDGIDFAYKTVGETVSNYGFDTKQIKVGKNEYLAIRISPPAGLSGSSGKTDWEIGFTVN